MLYFAHVSFSARRPFSSCAFCLPKNTQNWVLKRWQLCSASRMFYWCGGKNFTCRRCDLWTLPRLIPRMVAFLAALSLNCFQKANPATRVIIGIAFLFICVLIFWSIWMAWDKKAADPVIRRRWLRKKPIPGRSKGFGVTTDLAKYLPKVFIRLQQDRCLNLVTGDRTPRVSIPLRKLYH